MEMILSRLKVSYVAIREALLILDFKILTQDKIEMIKNAAPEGNEIDLFEQHPPEDISNLAMPDLFFLEIC